MWKSAAAIKTESLQTLGAMKIIQVPSDKSKDKIKQM